MTKETDPTQSDSLTPQEDRINALAGILEASDKRALSPEIRARILRFYALVLKENELQNLTRLLDPEQFFYGHIWDVFELLSQNILEYPALDLGSGVGIPGLLAAIMEDNQWILVESEKKKAEYLRRSVEALDLAKQVVVVADRVENCLKANSPRSVVVRAVGPVDRLYSWIRKCSTWNNLILFKGPGWENEWSEFQKTKYKKELVVATRHDYSVGPENKQRVIVELRRK